MHLRKPIKIFALLACLLLLTTLTGCGLTSKIVIYPINKTDFWIDDAGNIVMSEFYFKEVLKAKLDVSRLVEE